MQMSSSTSFCGNAKQRESRDGVLKGGAQIKKCESTDQKKAPTISRECFVGAVLNLPKVGQAGSPGHREMRGRTGRSPFFAVAR